MELLVHVLASGGIDSTVLAHHFSAAGDSVQLQFVDYGQPAAPWEAEAAAELAASLGTRLVEHYAPLHLPPGQEEVPGRNEHLVRTILPHVRGPALIALGIHGGTDYWDCSPAFVHQMQDDLDRMHGGSVVLDTPFLLASKGGVAKYGRELGVDLAETYCCLRGDPGHCMDCSSCIQRSEILGFAPLLA